MLQLRILLYISLVCLLSSRIGLVYVRSGQWRYASTDLFSSAHRIL